MPPTGAAGKTIFSFLVWSLLIYVALLLARAPWPAMDYIFTFLFHAYLAGVPLFILLLVVYAFLSLLRSAVGVFAKGEIGRAGGAFSAISRAAGAVRRLLDIIFILYCFSLLVAGVSMNVAFGLCAVALLLAAGEVVKISEKMNMSRHLRIGAAAAVCVVFTACMAAGTRLLTGIPVSAPTAAIFAAWLAASYARPGLFPSFPGFPGFPRITRATAWRNLSRNRYTFAAAGLLLIGMYYTWIPNLNRAPGAPEIISKKAIGGGAGIEPASDGVNIFYLNKSRKSVDLIDRRTFDIKGRVGVDIYPRQMAYDREKERLYVVDHSVRRDQMKVISTSPFRLLTTVSFPRRKCDQANAVAIDRARNRILVGCDDTGNLFFIDRTTLALTNEAVVPKPSGKGMVRIEIDSRRNRAFSFGGVTGPFINESDLAGRRRTATKFTGYLVWETARDPRTRQIFMSVPFRSIVAVLDEKSLDVTKVIRSGFGARAVAIDGKNNRLFIGAQISGLVEVYDLKTYRRLKRFYLPFPRYFYYDENEGVLYSAGSTGISRVKI